MLTLDPVPGMQVPQIHVLNIKSKEVLFYFILETRSHVAQASFNLLIQLRMT